MLVGVAGAALGVLALAGVLDVSATKMVAGLVVAGLAVPLGIAAIVAWVKLRPREGVARTEWKAPQGEWQQRFESSRVVTAVLAVGWVYFLVGTISLTTRSLTDDTVVSLIWGIGLVLLLTWALVKKWTRLRG